MKYYIVILLLVNSYSCKELFSQTNDSNNTADQSSAKELKLNLSEYGFDANEDRIVELERAIKQCNRRANIYGAVSIGSMAFGVYLSNIRSGPRSVDLAPTILGILSVVTSCVTGMKGVRYKIRKAELSDKMKSLRNSKNYGMQKWESPIDLVLTAGQLKLVVTF